MKKRNMRIKCGREAGDPEKSQETKVWEEELVSQSVENSDSLHLLFVKTTVLKSFPELTLLRCSLGIKEINN